VKIGIGVNKKIVVEKKTDADRSGIGTRITRIARSLSTVGNRTSSCPLLETALNAMVMIGMIDLIGSIGTMIGNLTSRLREEPQFMIGLGVGSVCMIDLVTVLSTFLGTKRSLKKWQMLEFPMSSYFAGMLTPIEWSQGKVVFHR
jgi:hypothetical protein